MSSSSSNSTISSIISISATITSATNDATPSSSVLSKLQVSPTATSPPNSSSDGGLGRGAMVGIMVGAAVGLTALTVLFCCIHRRYWQKKRAVYRQTETATESQDSRGALLGGMRVEGPYPLECYKEAVVTPSTAGGSKYDRSHIRATYREVVPTQFMGRDTGLEEMAAYQQAAPSEFAGGYDVALEPKIIGWMRPGFHELDDGSSGYQELDDRSRSMRIATGNG